MEDDKIIEFMADGLWHSGVDIAARFGLSRAAVWKRLQKLESIGLEIQREQAKGYRLAYSFEPLKSDYIAAQIANNTLLSIKPITTSTNSDALTMLKASSKLWPEQAYLCLAELQTAGKGRRGRQWQSPYGANLYFSWAATLPVGVAGLEGLSLAIGILVAKVLSQNKINDVKVKWPNDVYVDGKKIAGILIEVDGDLTSHCNLVVGVGVNFCFSSLHLETIGQPFTAVDCHSTLSRNEMSVMLTAGVEAVVRELCNGNTVGLLDEWSAYDYLLNKPVNISLGGQVITGVARGVSNTGNLIVELGDGELKHFAGGEVSVRIQ